MGTRWEQNRNKMGKNGNKIGIKWEQNRNKMGTK